MIRQIILVLIALMLEGCESDQERRVREMEEYVNDVIHADWRDGLPLGRMYQANEICAQNREFTVCTDLQWQLDDVAVTLESCRQDRRSKLCQAIVKEIGEHQLAIVLPEAAPVRLPASPFYWSLPTIVLETFASSFEYRREAFSLWWKTWRFYIASCIALLFGGYATWFGWRWWRRKKDEQEYENLLRQEAAAERKRTQMESKARAQAEAARRLQEEREEELAEQQLKAERQEAERLAAEEAARRAAEQAEAEAMLKAAFPKSKRVRKKNVPATQK